MKLRIEDLINFFPNDNFAVEIFDTICIGSDSLSDIASDEYGRSFITRDEFLDFCIYPFLFQLVLIYLS